LYAIEKVCFRPNNEISIPPDTAFEELRTSADAQDGSLPLALYRLAFSSYSGFKPS
jgi:hypothetical protein